MLREHPNSVVLSKPGDQLASVTVCISLYNYQDYIVETLESVQKQTLGLLDLLLVEDCSTDESLIVAAKWLQQKASRFNRIELIRHESNGGLAQARNTAISRALTSYIFVLDADNLLYPRCIERCLEVLEHNPEAVMSYPIIEKFGADHSLMGNVVWEPTQFTKQNCIDAMGLIRRQVLLQVDGYSNMHVPGWEDYELWCKLIDREFYGVLVPEILAKYRTHANSMINSISNRTENIECLHREMKELHPWLELS